MILVYENKNGAPKFLDRLKDFDPRQYHFKEEAKVEEPVKEPEAPVVTPPVPPVVTPVDTIPVETKIEVSEEDKARFADLTAQRAWLKKDLKEEYNALKLKLK